MEFIATILSALASSAVLFFGALVALFVLALVFGKRVEKKWDYEGRLPRRARP